MNILDNLTKTITQGVDRAKFEAEKFQKTTRVQGELNEARKQYDEKLRELGQRAYELFRAGQIGAPTVSSLAQELDLLQGQIIVRQEELQAAQNEVFIEKTPPPTQHVPVEEAPTTPASGPIYTPPPQTTQPPAYSSPTAAHTKTCPTCHFQMPQTALFCPSCGTRVG